ncbi:electron transfer flavoprotein-quinone oxidoreductase [Geothermobacter ehrlichii]|uniref:Electron transfer flavoprotein-quinone oxidoreductase n=1 Tax=Geothermobacter ehrlichii TaxID=213224 RepID=A0A5D3WKI0_9BACT|nr:FAD-dependent oxidoreductase [Geothermobacter ehrlichii]TYO98436.1 electron transfer flavoprotein-quinone oxidoreductase [Geothermobacter ehrlichii]
MKNLYDVIIVGAGPAGLSSAICLADHGLKPLVLERGSYPGSKNMFGGVIYGRILEKLIPNFWETAPIERFVSRRRITFLSNNGATTFAHYNSDFLIPPHNGFTVLRPKFDKWLADIAEQRGAEVVCAITVSDVVKNDECIKLILDNGREEVCARVVVAADGVNSVVGRKCGLRSDFDSFNVAVGVKETLYLPKKEIEKRFNLQDKEGHANEFVGHSLDGLVGGGFLYTNEDSISIGIIAQIASLKEKGLSPGHVLESFKGHSYIASFIRGAQTSEYSAHLIPELDYDSLPSLYGDRLLLTGDAAGFVLNTGYNLEGVNYAIGSGIAAAKSVIHALGKGDFSKKTLSVYKKHLGEHNILSDLKSFRYAGHFISNKRLHKDYPELLNNVTTSLFAVTGDSKKKIKHHIHEEIKKIGYANIVKDFISAIRGVL